MARRFIIQGTVADGDYLSEEMSASYSVAELSQITFYSDEYATEVTPSAGTVTFTMSADGEHYRNVADGSFAAADAYDPARNIPSGTGLAIKAKVNLAGVTGATNFKAIVWRM